MPTICLKTQRFIQENVRDARKSVENGRTEGANWYAPLNSTYRQAEEKFKKQKKKDKAALESNERSKHSRALCKPLC